MEQELSFNLLQFFLFDCVGYRFISKIAMKLLIESVKIYHFVNGKQKKLTMFFFFFCCSREPFQCGHGHTGRLKYSTSYWLSSPFIVWPKKEIESIFLVAYGPNHFDLGFILYSYFFAKIWMCYWWLAFTQWVSSHLHKYGHCDKKKEQIRHVIK